jgi:RNA polymerase sigma-70 factor, ECF subfamily
MYTNRPNNRNLYCNLAHYKVVSVYSMSTGLNDNEIISKVLNGDQQAYAGLVDRYKSYVFTLALRFTKNREDAEEVSQDIFIKAYRYLADFRGASKFSTWLYTIVNTTCITFLRKKKLETHSLDNEKVFDVADSQDSGMRANLIEQKSRVSMVNKAIAMLNTDDAEIITLFYKGEQTLEEISQILGIEPNTAKVRLHRARTRLKEKMETYFSQEIKDLN